MTDTPPSCIFCEIAAGRIPATIVAESDRLVAFLDIRPIRPGHVLIVPRDHYAYFDDLPPDLAADVLQLGQRLAKAMKRAYGVERAGFLFTGTDVAHVHAHVVPMHEKTDITSPRYISEQPLTIGPAPVMQDDELAHHASILRASLA